VIHKMGRRVAACRGPVSTGSARQKRFGDMIYGLLTGSGLAPRFVVRSALGIMWQSAGLLPWFSPALDTRVVCTELQNKIEVFSLFQYVDSDLGITGAASPSLQDLVTRASQLEPYRAVWTKEGVGRYYTDMRLHSRQFSDGLLCETRTAELPAASLVPLHAGMGLSLAQSALDLISKQPADCRILIEEFTRRCRLNSRKGYFGAAFEALGFLSRTLYPNVLSLIDSVLSKRDDLLAYFWHGIGRGIYFGLTNLPPFCNAPWNALQMCMSEPPHEAGRSNAVAGLAWALTLVNIRHPEIMVAFLRHHGEQMADSEAFANGVCSAMIVWRDAAPNDRHLDALRRHAPDRSSASLLELWHRYVRRPLDEALRYHDILRTGHSLSEAFRCQQLAKFANRNCP
jgi:hypothetical protein